MDGYREIVPPPALAPWVAAYWIWEGLGAAGRSYRVVPDGCIDLLFSVECHGGTETASLTAVGTMSRPLLMTRHDVPLLLGVRFKPGGARSFLGGMPAAELTDLHPSLEEVWGKEALPLEERLREASSLEECLRLFEAALLDRLRRGGEDLRDPLVEAAVERLERASDGVALPRLASEMGLGPRQLRRRFLDAVGIAPKRLARVLRFQKLLGRTLAAPERGWAELALDAGYYDQAHMIRDFRNCTGLSPRRYLAERGAATRSLP